MPVWIIPITIVEHHRTARVEAPTKKEAIAKVRRAEWDDETALSDPERYDIRVVGPCEEVGE